MQEPAPGQIFHMIHDDRGRRLADYEVTSGSAVLLQEYIWLEDRVLATIANNGTTEGRFIHIHADHMSRPVAGYLDGADGSLVYGVTYTPFGETHAVAGANLPELGFPGQWFREESGLFQNWMRDYDPSLGAYIQPDPLGLVDGPAVYRYAGGNPIRYSDPREENTLALRPVIRPLLKPLLQPIVREIAKPIIRAGVVQRTLGEIVAKQTRDARYAASNTIPWPKQKGRWYSCICRAHKDGRSVRNCANGPEYGWGYGVARELNVAKDIARRAALDDLSAVSSHHVQCKCTGPKGGRYASGSGVR